MPPSDEMNKHYNDMWQQKQKESLGLNIGTSPFMLYMIFFFNFNDNVDAYIAMKFYRHDLVFGNKMIFGLNIFLLRNSFSHFTKYFKLNEKYICAFLYFYAPRICIQWNKACFSRILFFICCTRQCESEKNRAINFIFRASG